jgi:glycosyltransferase involved in cell wall biosynthesis
MVQRHLWRRWRKAFDLIVANSEAVRRSLVADGIEPVEVVVNGVPVGSSRQLLAPRPFVVFAGRLVAEKGADVLLRAFALVVAQIPQATLLLMGDGPELGRLKELTAELGLTHVVSIPGFVPHAEVERACEGAWVQVVPSRWAEPFGKAAAEAMMRGTAVIASNCGGLAEIVQHQRTGLLVPPGDADALAAAMLRLLRDRSSTERMGKVGRGLALARFSEDIWIDRFVALYRTLDQNHSRTTIQGTA